MRIFLSDEDVSGKIRELEVARNVSAIATLPFVRNFVDEQLHRLGAKGCVMDGRDIGTAVFPNANLKIFMTADAEIRAQRRVKKLIFRFGFSCFKAAMLSKRATLPCTLKP